MILSITYDKQSYVIVSGTSIIWTAPGSFVSTIVFLNKAKGTILFAILGSKILGNGILILITVSFMKHVSILLTSALHGFRQNAKTMKTSR